MPEIKKKSPNNNIKTFFSDFKSEIKKVSWPGSKETFRNTSVVLTAIIIVGIFIFILDAGLYALLSRIMNISSH
jgi:preprotein translocase subunit SecE